MSDINRLVKPLIESPYRPEEVDSIYNNGKQEEQIEMASAEIVGLNENKKGLVEVNRS